MMLLAALFSVNSLLYLSAAVFTYQSIRIVQSSGPKVGSAEVVASFLKFQPLGSQGAREIRSERKIERTFEKEAVVLEKECVK